MGIRIGLFAFLLLTILITVTEGFVPSLIFGPHDVTKRTERKVYGADSGDVIVIDTVDQSCGSVDGFSVTAYYIGSRVEQKTKSWSFNGPCFSVLPTFVASTYVRGKGSVVIAVKGTNLTEVFNVNSNGFTKLGDVEYGFSLTNFGLFSYDDSIFYYNEGKIQNLAVNVSFIAPVGATFKKISTDGTDIYVGAKVSGELALGKIDLQTPGFLSSVTLQSTINSPIIFGSDYNIDDPVYIQKEGIQICGDRVMVTLVKSDLSRATILGFDQDLNPLFTKQYDLTAEERLLDYACDDATNEVFTLFDRIDTSGLEIVFYYKFERLNSNGTLIQSYDLWTNETSLESTPAYSAIVTTPLGTTYAHRQDRQDLGANTEVFGILYSRCTTGQFGKSCQTCACTCDQGVCDWGELGSGKCTQCNTNKIAGPNCDLSCNCLLPSTPCSNGINGDAHCICDTSAAIGFNCSSCENGYYLDPSNICSICPIKFYCVDSAKIACEYNDVPGLSYCKDAPTIVPTTVAPTQAPTTTNAPDDESNTKDIVPIIIGAVFGGLVLLIIIICIIVYCCYIKKKRTPKAQYVQTNQTNELTVM